ncbi:MAG: adenylate kinase [Bacteroidetes bacterium]|jgi:adenylate kinase|nr:adenylate kinase [Bacteroidota bacterium]MBT3748549.1 adenylate kinase [Bacteroidota bacterium]MBT4398978.1 adenylate kinase [Bacteroidota bacterium]MBT4411258.1 adenylate kinase [Bacteroidota bacterium]MBT5426345.1 adenylate kinase [Bacteroidota bacterium]
MIHLILFGPPGVGKGTQSQRIIQHFDLLHIASGDLLRIQIMNQSDLGIKAKLYMDKGELVPDEIVISMIESILSSLDGKNGVVFDGFPRTPPQAEALDGLLKSRGEEISALVALKVPKEELVKRLESRGLTSGRADDSSIKTIENRLKVYDNKTSPVIKHYSEQGKYHPVNGVGMIDDVSKRLIDIIEPIVEAI